MFLNLFSGKDFFFEYPNGDQLYSVVALYQAKEVRGELVMLDGESTKLQYFSLDDLPKLEKRAAAILKWYKGFISASAFDRDGSEQGNYPKMV